MKQVKYIGDVLGYVHVYDSKFKIDRRGLILEMDDFHAKKLCENPNFIILDDTSNNTHIEGTSKISKETDKKIKNNKVN